MQPTNEILVVKIGGSTLGAQDTSLADVAALAQQGIQPVVVHGGGAAVTRWMARMGVQAEFVQGLRVTDASSLEVVIAVLSGLINKQLVATLLSMEARAVGVSGADGALLRGIVERPELGFVVSRLTVDPEPIQVLVNAGYIPVIAPLALLERPEEGAEGQLLNVNADTAAGAIAGALQASRLVFLTDVDGVLDPNGRLIPRISSRQGDGFIHSGVVKGGMVPKLEACLYAAARGTPSHMVNGTRPSALLDCINGTLTGTSVI